uniref:Brain protein I3 n=1 Tax=Globodera rostochiensis TaxID=31243 RepID=A0A914HFE2_GLORO
MKSNDYGSVTGAPPSAPPMEHTAVPQSVQSFPHETVTPLQGAVQPQLSQTQMQAPPPPYNEAIHYPPAPPYSAYQPNTFQNVPAAHQPQQNSAPPTVTYMTPTGPIPMPTIISTTTILPSAVVPPTRTNPCARCPHGTIRSEADCCCLFCLLVFSVISFPFGLVLLLFIPLAFRRRCSACRHLYT